MPRSDVGFAGCGFKQSLNVCCVAGSSPVGSGEAENWGWLVPEQVTVRGRCLGPAGGGGGQGVG